MSSMIHNCILTSGLSYLLCKMWVCNDPFILQSSYSFSDHLAIKNISIDQLERALRSQLDSNSTEPEANFAIETITYGLDSLWLQENADKGFWKSLKLIVTIYRVKLWQCPSKPLLCTQNEHWYDIHVWGPIVDKAFLDCEDVDIVRFVLKILLEWMFGEG
jgi:hypothetical protein